MASKATYSFKFNTTKINQLKTNVNAALTTMAIDIQAQAHRNAPHDSGNLKRTLRNGVEDNNTHFVAAGGTFGGIVVPYAKRREYENNKNPQTKHYMKNAFEAITKDYSKYFKGVTK